MIRFNWRPYQENIAILGMQGTGKTTLARKILGMIPQVHRWIWSPQLPLQNFAGFGEATPIHTLHTVTGGARIITGEFSAANFDKFCECVMRQRNLLVVIDDMHERVTKQKIPYHCARMINSGRNIGICGLWISTSPNQLNNVPLQSAQHYFAFKFGLESQIKWLAQNVYGPDAYALLPRPLRRVTPLVGNEYETLPKHSYLYRYHSDTESQLFLGGQNEGVQERQEV